MEESVSGIWSWNGDRPGGLDERCGPKCTGERLRDPCDTKPAFSTAGDER
jgi:hypothetical protein